VDGRAGDLIITGGENVWPEAVEAVLLGHPAVVDAAVAGRDDPEWGQRVCAWIVVRAGCDAPTLEELREHVKHTLPSFAAPRRLTVVDALPRTSLGKIRRASL
jgi:O-succinylbenzoic acid--CoA ligase